MPVEIHVGPPILTINHGSSFMVSDLNGEVHPDSEHGIFARDTRFLSYYALFADGRPWQLVTSSATRYYASAVYLSNQEIATETGTIPDGTLGLVVNRSVVDGIHEDLDLTNYGVESVRFNLEVALRS